MALGDIQDGTVMKGVFKCEFALLTWTERNAVE